MSSSLAYVFPKISRRNLFYQTTPDRKAMKDDIAQRVMPCLMTFFFIQNFLAEISASYYLLKNCHLPWHTFIRNFLAGICSTMTNPDKKAMKDDIAQRVMSCFMAFFLFKIFWQKFLHLISG